MTTNVYRCILCGLEIPADWIGAELMKAHLNEEHPGGTR